MDQDRWKKVNQIFHAALELDASQRHKYVQDASEGDHELREEVELLLKADSNAGSYLESPLISQGHIISNPSRLNPGDDLCSRFRILRAVGEGGMGQVFEAFDSELAVSVALKVIRSEIATNPGVLARFRQEVRLARRITHPNVCRTFDIEHEARVVDSAQGTKEDVVFLTMEFLEGETLASRIKRAGALPKNEAFQIASQIADALDAAHKLGIIHRDMKPANVMLVPINSSAVFGFRAVITDFGLARLDPIISSGNHSALSHTAHPIGTLAYMAPEQLENAAISTATDIYAFGLVMFEMVTGQRAFPSQSFLSGIAQRLGGPPPAPEALVPDLPEVWRRAIEGCLRIKPADRFQSAADVIVALESTRIVLPRVGKLPVSRSSEPWSLKRKLNTLASIFVVAVALIFGGLRLYRSGGDPTVGPGALVYLTRVKNLTGEKGFDNLTDMIQAGLAQSIQINLLDQSRAGDILQQMTKDPDTVIDPSIAREIAMRSGAARVVFATVSRSSEGYQLDIDIQQPDNTPTRPRHRWEKRFFWKSSSNATRDRIPTDLLEAVRSASDWIRHEVGESRNDIAYFDAPPEDVTTGSWEALAEYSEALRMTSRGQQEKAVEVLEDAVRIDPRFSLAFAKLGDILLSIDRTQEGYEAYSRALSTDDLNRLTRRERDRIKGIYASDTQDYETAENAFRDYSTYYENDYLGWFYRALPLKMLGRAEESVSVLRKAVALSPDSLASEATLADELIVLGQFDEAQKQIGKLKDQGHIVEATWRIGDIAFLEQRYQDAEAAYKMMASSSEIRFQGISSGMLARLAAEQGEYEKAISIIRGGIAYDVAHGNTAEHAAKLLDLAYLHIKLGDFGDCIADINTAIALDSAPTTYLRASATLGQAYQQAPPATLPKIRQELNNLQHRFSGPDYGVISRMTRLRLRAENLLASGDTPRALVEFLKADAIQAPADEREYLGRAYFALASKEQKGPHHYEWIVKACNAYAKFALQPRFAWDEALHHPPGFLADQSGMFLHLAIETNRMDAGAIQVLSAFARLRPTEMQRSPDLQRARQQWELNNSQNIQPKEASHG